MADHSAGVNMIDDDKCFKHDVLYPSADCSCRAMTIDERARKIVDECVPKDDNIISRLCLRDTIAAQLREVERKARDLGQCKTHGIERRIVCSICVVEAAYANGFNAAREKAAGMVEGDFLESPDQLDSKPKIIVFGLLDKLAERIRGMEP